MESSFNHNVPWELILSSLQNTASAEERVQLQNWMLESVKNKELFEKMGQLWTEGLPDYAIYQAANEDIAWDNLKQKLSNDRNDVDGNSNVIRGDFSRKGNNLSRIIQWMSVAAVCILVVGAYMWLSTGKSGNIYQTAGNEQTVTLPDGSYVRLYPRSRIEISKAYNKNGRVVVLREGAAFFEVKHDERNPFTVDLNKASVRDVGTSFYISNRKDSIVISVKSGAVEFRDKDSVAKNLSAGMTLKYIGRSTKSEPLIFIDSAAAADKGLLNFDNTVLNDVIAGFSSVYNKQIVLTDSALGTKRFTAHLDGQSFEDAMNILCKSLGIKYFKENDVYYLKND